MSHPNGPQSGGFGQPGGQPQWGQAGPPAQGGGYGNNPYGQARGGFDISKLRPGQWIALVLWLLLIVAMSIPYVSISYDYGYGASGSTSASGWSIGGMNVIFFICALLAAVAAAVEAFMPQLQLPVPMAFITGGLLALGGLFGVIEFLTNLDGIEYFSVGAWLVLILALVALAGAALEIMHGLKQQPSSGGSQWGQQGGGQWGQPAGGQWGQQGGQPGQVGPGAPGQPGQWGQPGQQPGQPGQPGQWGQPGQPG